MPPRFALRVPSDYLLKRDLCSYGYFLLAPNQWIPEKTTLIRPFELPGGPVTLALNQPTGRGKPVAVHADRSLSRTDRAAAEPLIRRMLNLDDPGVADFHRVDPRWKRSGRARLFRSPTFFEDLVKTVTSCNVTWPSTVTMNRRLCDVINPAFPSPRQLARKRPAMLRARCGVGYRDARLVKLAKMHADGAIDPDWFENPANSDEEVFKALLDLPGIGPYGAANLMQLLGRYSRLAIDTESIRHGKTVLGISGTDRQITKALNAHYEPFGLHKFRSYWFEMWTFYESKHGMAWTWEPKTTGRAFTASLLKD
jgi:3-methyladenine DNA glycosylase/8-oxoguanine DNA glycosylase